VNPLPFFRYLMMQILELELELESKLESELES
jgi:hypothetical protein